MALVIANVKRRFFPLALAAILLYLALAQPNHPDALTWGVLKAFPLEWPFLLLALFAFGPGRIGTVFRVLVVAAIAGIATLKTADFAMFLALARGFNPVADLALVGAGLRLLSGTIGPALAGLAALGFVLLIALVIAALWWATGVLASFSPSKASLRAAAGVGAFVFAGISAAEVGDRMQRWELPWTLPGTAFTTRVGVERLAVMRATLRDLRSFEDAAGQDRFANRDGLLDAIDRDVLVVFIESYGRTSLDTPLFSDLHRATLAEAEETLSARGLAMASGLLASPTRGGQSWLAHATFANGLWVDGQTRYAAVLASGRQTLFHLAAKAGFHTAAVMPQITLEWPESSRMGFETILAAADLGYAGLSFNWVTMPDQFVYTAIDRLLRANRGDDDRHVFLQFATGSSHAPWVPVPELLAWDAIDNGHVFDAMAVAGDTPDEVWRDNARVRAQYRRAVDYALRTAFAYVERHADDPPLMIVLGDHQAAGFVALDERPDVPLHLIGPPHLIARAASDWDLSAGLLPAEGLEVVAMDRMRDRILRTFSSATPSVNPSVSPPVQASAKSVARFDAAFAAPCSTLFKTDARSTKTADVRVDVPACMSSVEAIGPSPALLDEANE